MLVVLLESNGVDLDEAGSVGWLVVTLHVHAYQSLVVQSLGRLTALDVHVALVDGDSDGTVNVLLTLGDHIAHKITLRAEPETVVDDLGEAWHQRLLNLSHFL